MKIRCIFCWVWLLALTSCEEDLIKQTCGVVNPTQNIQWLQVQVQSLQQSEYCQFVKMGNLDGSTVFVLGNCAPEVNSIESVYDCDGNLLCYSGDETCPDFSREVKDLEVVWTNGK